MTFADDLDKERERILLLIDHASASWAAAMRAHVLAPPDAGFAARLRALSEAAATEQVAWEQAEALGLMWRPVPGAEHTAPPYELRAGTARRGPENLWAVFDEAVANLNRAIAGSSSGAVAAAFGVMGSAAGGLADAVAQEDQISEMARERMRAQRAAAV